MLCSCFLFMFSNVMYGNKSDRDWSAQKILFSSRTQNFFFPHRFSTFSHIMWGASRATVENHFRSFCAASQEGWRVGKWCVKRERKFMVRFFYLLRSLVVSFNWQWAGAGVEWREGINFQSSALWGKCDYDAVECHGDCSWDGEVGIWRGKLRWNWRWYWLLTGVDDL